jgi:hypothetical protein
MSEEKRTTVVQQLVFGQMVVAEGIRAAHTTETVSGVQQVRTVATSHTTGNVSVRYVPRSGQAGGSIDTKF